MSTSPAHLTILGAGPGISAGVARRFGRAGHAVTLVARGADKLARETELLAATGIAADWVVADLAREDALLAALDTVEQRHGEPWLVVYNAAAGRAVDLLDEDWPSLRGFLDTSVGGAFVTARRLLPRFLAANRGALFLTGGGLALKPDPGMASVCLGKAGLRALAQSLAARVAGTDVRVATVTVCGYVQPSDTRYNADAVAEVYWRLFSEQPAGAEWEVVY